MACLHSQNRLRSLFVEAPLPHPDTGAVEHGEWDRQGSFWNLGDGPVYEEPCTSEQGWVERIHQRSGIAPEIIRGAWRACS